MRKTARICLAVAAAAIGSGFAATPASADVVSCTTAYHAAITDEYYLYYADYPYSFWVRQNTVKYLDCLTHGGS